MLKKLPPSLRNTVNNTSWLLADRIVRMGIGLIVGVFVARYLGPSGFGNLNFALSFIALIATVTTLGLDNIVVRNIVRDDSHTSEVLGTAFALRFWTSLAVSACVILGCRLARANDETSTLLISILSVSFIFQSFDVIDFYFQSQLQAKFVVIAKTLAFLVTAAFRLLLIYLREPVWWFAVAYVAELALAAAGLVWAFGARGRRFRSWTVSRGRALQMLSESWPVLFSGMAIMVYMRIDVVMLKAMQDDRAVGVYATATRISEVWYFVSSAIVSSVAPSIIRSLDNPAVYYARIEKLFSMMSLLAISIGACIAIFSKLIVVSLYSKAFAAAAPVLAVHVWASVFVFLGVAQGPWDLSQNLLKLAFYRTVAGAVANILLNFILIPRYAAMGAAISTVISYAVSAVLGNAFSARTRPIFFLQLKSLYFNKLLTPIALLR